MDLSVIYDSLMPKSLLVRKMILAGISAFLFVNIFQNIWKILGILLAIIAAGIVFCTQTNYCANVSLSSIKEKIVNFASNNILKKIISYITSIFSKNFSDDIKTESVSPENVRSESINKKENYDYY